MRVSGARFVCPIDGLALVEAPGGLQCARSHSFDRAAEGYVNLLLVQHKASRNPGDDKRMVAARRQILDGGFFTRLESHMSATVLSLVRQAGSHRTVRVLDAGCGDGYYLHRLVEAARAIESDGALELAGTDISKWAVRAAAKRSSVVAWAVATNAHLPFADGSLDLVLSLFGFPVWQSFARVVAPGGHLLLADAGPDHLIELRSIGYPTVERGGVPSLDAALAAGFELAQQERLSYHIELESAAQITAMLSMTPHVHRMPATGRAALAELRHQRVTIDVVFRLLVFNGGV